MASFIEDFNEADQTLSALANWSTLDDTPAESQGIEVFQTYATNEDAVAAIAIVTGAGNVATGVPQAASIDFAFAEEGDESYVRVGVCGDTDTDVTGFAGIEDWNAGVFAKLIAKANGVRTLEVGTKWNGATERTYRSVDLVLAGGIENEEYRDVLLRSGALGERQTMRLVVTERDSGLRADVYLNTDDDDKAVLSVDLDTDFITPGVDATDFGSWWFGTGGATARTIKVHAFVGADYTIATDREVQEQRADQPTIRELMDVVKVRFERSANTDLDPVALLDAIVDTHEHILLELGDVAWFMVRTESIALTPTTFGRVTFDPKVERVLSIENANGYGVAFWFEGLTTNGAVQVQMQTAVAGAYRVRYVLRTVQVKEETDLSPIPRRFRECVVLGACMRLAEQDRGNAQTSDYRQQFGYHLGLMKTEQGRHTNQARARMRPFRANPPRYHGYLG